MLKKTTVITVLVLIGNLCKAQTNQSNKHIHNMLKDFYRAVSYVWTNATPDITISMVGRQLDSLAQKYCTRDLRLKAKKIYETTSFDLLMNENSYEIVPPESLIVVNDSRPNAYIVSYKSMDQDASGKRIPTAVTLHVVVVKSKDGYRISEIK